MDEEKIQMKIAIMTDSTAYIPTSLIEKYHIYSVPLNVQFNEESYQEGIELGPVEFYEKMNSTGVYPKTSQPAVGDFLHTYREIAKEYDAVISLHISSGISGTYQTARTMQQEIEDLEIYPFDTEITTIVQGYLVIEAAKLAEQHKTPEEIIEHLTDLRRLMRAYFMVDDLGHLQRGGRLSHAQAMLGNLLKVKPLLYFRDTKIQVFEKIRTKKRAIKRIMDMLYEDAEQDNIRVVFWIYADDEHDVHSLRTEFEEKYPHIKTETSYFGPVIGTHLGAGAIGVGWYKKS